MVLGNNVRHGIHPNFFCIWGACMYCWVRFPIVFGETHARQSKWRHFCLGVRPVSLVVLYHIWSKEFLINLCRFLFSRLLRFVLKAYVIENSKRQIAMVSRLEDTRDNFGSLCLSRGRKLWFDSNVQGSLLKDPRKLCAFHTLPSELFRNQTSSDRLRGTCSEAV